MGRSAWQEEIESQPLLADRSRIDQRYPLETMLSCGQVSSHTSRQCTWTSQQTADEKGAIYLSIREGIISHLFTKEEATSSRHAATKTKTNPQLRLR